VFDPTDVDDELTSPLSAREDLELGAEIMALQMKLLASYTHVDALPGHRR